MPAVDLALLVFSIADLRRGGEAGTGHALAAVQWRRHLLAWALGCALLLAGTADVGDPERTQAPLRVAGIWTLVLAVDFLISFSYSVFPRRSRA